MTRFERILKSAIDRALLDTAPHALVLYNLDACRRRFTELREAFPPTTLHAPAIKACPLVSLLQLAAEAGFGAEAATLTELELARAAGVPADQTVFDSPAKTLDELRHAMDLGVHVNADNLQELDRIARLVGESSGPCGSFGVRINPEIGAGTIVASSTAAPGTKFGVSLRDDGAALLDRFERYAWLTGVHVHVGSQGCPVSMLVEGAAAAAAFVQEVERRCGGGRIRTFDIGGGLPVAYRPADPSPRFEEVADGIRRSCPWVFERNWRLVTEFGRAIWADSAVAVSRVEYTKSAHGRRIAVVHFGADLFVRSTYLPDVWRHELSAFDAAGRPKTGEPIEQDVAGPLCFSGDLVARGRPLPLLEPGDVVMVHDVGAYTLSMWSRYNSRRSPAVYGYCDDTGDFTLLRPAESVADVMRFWDR